MKGKTRSRHRRYIAACRVAVVALHSLKVACVPAGHVESKVAFCEIKAANQQVDRKTPHRADLSPSYKLAPAMVSLTANAVAVNIVSVGPDRPKKKCWHPAPTFALPKLPHYRACVRTPSRSRRRRQIADRSSPEAHGPCRLTVPCRGLLSPVEVTG